MIKRSILLSLAVALGVLMTPATNALLINVEDAYEVSARRYPGIPGCPVR